MILLAALVGCGGPVGPEAVESGALRRGGHVLGTAHRIALPLGSTWNVEYADGGRAWSATLDDDGRVATYEDFAPRPPTVKLTRDDEGWTWTLGRFGGGTAEGRLQLPTAPIWLPGGGPAVRGWALGAHDLLWDGRAAVDAVATERAEADGALRLTVTAGADTWAVALDAHDVPVEVRWPDGTTWKAGDVAGDTPLAAAALVYPTTPLPDAKQLRRLVVRPPGGAEVTVERPLWAEVPPGGPGAFASDAAPATAIPDVPPFPLALPAGLDRRALVRAAFDAVVRGRGDGDDCKALAWRLAGGLRSAGVPAEVVLGLVYSHDRGPAFVHHAWVRVPFDGLQLDVDPALGQLVADPTHLPSDVVGELPPGAPITIVEAR